VIVVDFELTIQRDRNGRRVEIGTHGKISYNFDEPTISFNKLMIFI